MDQLLPDRRQEDEVDELRVELTATLGGDRLGGVPRAALVLVAPPVRDRVECVGKRHDAGGKWNAASAEAAWVTRAVPSLVVGQHAVRELRVEAAERRKDRRAAFRVRGDGAAVLGSERRLVVDDVEQRLVDLSDVVEQCDALDGATFAAAQTGSAGDDEGVGRDAADVRAGLCVIRVYRVQQRLQRRCCEALGRASRSALVDDDRASYGAHDEGGGSHVRGRLSQKAHLQT